ncbi:hypothetical protein N7455_004918 [Penicillium solitum]|uniref:uncharacterized protein n=1 Tax=Penicillium solitum TaxID=60172 RepID=UPI0032C431A0|nr:hypothetical protein N7536_001292 [Penicillium majusculum]KAJ5869977.1 hypothetical protein N7455_004918 [Penicillium solitum]
MPGVVVAQWPRVDAPHCLELGFETARKVRRQRTETTSFEHGLNVDHCLNKLRRTISRMARPNLGSQFMGNPTDFE